MKSRQIVVNLLIVIAMATLAFSCYTHGKADIIFVENMPFDHEGVSYDAFDAIQVTADDSNSPLFLLEGDRGTVTIVGRSHILVIEELDDNDNVTGTHSVSFRSGDLKGQVINVVPLIHGKLPGWNYPLN